MAKISKKVVDTTNENAPVEAVMINNALSENNAEQQTAEGQNEAPKERKPRRSELEKAFATIEADKQRKAAQAAEAERCKPLIAEYKQTLISGACKLLKADDLVVPATLSKMLIPNAQIERIREQQAANPTKLVYWDFVKEGVRIATVADILSVDLVNANEQFIAADKAISDAKAAKNDLFNLEHYNK